MPLAIFTDGRGCDPSCTGCPACREDLAELLRPESYARGALPQRAAKRRGVLRVGVATVEPDIYRNPPDPWDLAGLAAKRNAKAGDPRRIASQTDPLPLWNGTPDPYDLKGLQAQWKAKRAAGGRR